MTTVIADTKAAAMPGADTRAGRTAPLRLVDTRELSHQQWLAVRNQGIGSSEAAAAIGLSPYVSPLELWQRKTAREPAPDLQGNEAVFWGSALEPLIAQVYQERTGRRVRRVNAVLQHPEHRFMLASLDRTVEGDGILEVKTAGWRSASAWEDGIPEVYQCQVLHQLAVTGRAWADVAVLIAGQEFRVYRIHRGEDGCEARIAQLIAREQEFWQYVQSDTPPPVDGSPSSARALAAMYPGGGDYGVDLSDCDELNHAFAMLLQCKGQRQALQQQEELYRQKLQAAMGQASSAVLAAGRISWKRSKDSRSIDCKRLALEHPQLAAQYESTTPGVRRFLMQVTGSGGKAPEIDER